MSLWGVHVGLAVLATTVLLYAVETRYTVELDAWRRWGIVLASGAWAVVPDLYVVFPGLRPVLKPHVHDAALANLFWFHGWIDAADPGDSPVLSLAMGSLAVAVFLIAEVARRGRQRSATARKP